jgi:hypothetical protein
LDVKLVAILVLASIPFAGIVMLVWKGPRSGAARLYHQAAAQRDAAAEEVERMRLRLAAADQRLTAIHQRLAGKGEEE